MPVKKRLTAASVAGNNGGGRWLFVVILAAAAFVFFKLVTGIVTRAPGKGTVKKFTEKYADSYKQFFVTKTKRYRAMGLPLSVIGTNLGTDFWTKEFPALVSAAEVETNAILLMETTLNGVDASETREIDLADHPEIWNLLSEGARISGKSSFNVSAGALFNLWKNEDGVRVIPSNSLIGEALSFAKKENVVFDSEKKRVSVGKKGTQFDLDLFKEALFLKNLKKRLPESFDYRIYLGNRHGIWKLPLERMRWTVTIDNPYKIMGYERGALRLYLEEGAFAISRRREDYFKYKKKIYDFPVDWRTGRGNENSLAAMVIDSDPVKARLYSYALYISSDEERAEFEKTFPDVTFAVLKNDDRMYVPEKSRTHYLSLEEIENLRKKTAEKVEPTDKNYRKLKKTLEDLQKEKSGN